MSGSLKDKSEKCWRLAEKLRESGDFNNCASRMYYAVFQAVKEYAVQKKQYVPKDDPAERGVVHGDMRRIVRDEFHADHHYETYEYMRILRNAADYDPNDVLPNEIDRDVVYQLQIIKDYFLKGSIK